MRLSIEQVLASVLPLLRPEGHHAGVDGGADVDLAAVAAAVELSPWHAQRVVTTLMGESPSRHRRRRRLERAAVELLATDRRIIDVAIDAGYSSHEAFTRAFARAFGRTPSTYRNLARSGQLGELATMVAAVGPCVHLYRVPLHASTVGPISPIARTSTDPGDRDTRDRDTRDEEPDMESAAEGLDVERRVLTETPTLHQVRRVDRTELAVALSEILPAVYQHIIACGTGPGGPPYMRYLAASPAFLTIEAGMPLTGNCPPDPDAGIEAGVLPGGEAAVVVHVGPYEGLPDTHASLDRWLEANGERPAGPSWESYVTDPGETPDPAQWRTEVIWPLSGG